MRDAQEFAEVLRAAVEEELGRSLDDRGERYVQLEDSGEIGYRWRGGKVAYMEEDEEDEAIGKRVVVRLGVRVVVESVEEEDL